MPVGRPWVTRRENAPQNIDYSAMWSSSRCPEIHAVKAMYLYLFFGANLEDQTASVFIETRCFPINSTAGEQFPYLKPETWDRLHLQIGDPANQFAKKRDISSWCCQVSGFKYGFCPSAVLTTFYHFTSETAWVLYHVWASARSCGGVLPCVAPWGLI